MPSIQTFNSQPKPQRKDTWRGKREKQQENRAPTKKTEGERRENKIMEDRK